MRKLTKIDFASITFVFASFELLYFPLKDIVPRELFSACCIILSVLSVLVGVFWVRLFDKNRFLVCWAVICVLVIYSIFSFFHMGSMVWVGTSLKYIIYVLFWFLLLQFENIDEQSRMLRFVYLYCGFLLCVSVIGGLALNNTMVLNGRFRFLGLAHTSSVFSMFCAVYCIFLFWYQSKVKTTVLGVTLCALAFFLTWYSGSRQPAMALTLVVLLFILRSRLMIFLFGQLKTITALSILAGAGFLYTIDLNPVFDELKILSGTDGSLYSRIAYMSVGNLYLLENNLIFFGSGFNSFPSIYLSETSLEAPATHNLVLTLLMNFGIFGVIIAVLIAFFKVPASKFDVTLVVTFFLIGTSLNNPDYFVSIMLLFIFVLRSMNFAYLRS